MVPTSGRVMLYLFYTIRMAEGIRSKFKPVGNPFGFSMTIAGVISLQNLRMSLVNRGQVERRFTVSRWTRDQTINIIGLIIINKDTQAIKQRLFVI